jgi:hypothetical protein
VRRVAPFPGPGETTILRGTSARGAYVSRECRRIVQACFVLIASTADPAAAQATLAGEAPARPAAPVTAATAAPDAAPAAGTVAEKRAGPPPGTPGSTETAPEASAAAEPRRGRLVIDTNATCVLRIGGVVHEQVLLLPDAPRTVAVVPGEVAIERQ